LTAFVDTLRAILAERKERVAVIVSADLAHLGQRFGDRELINQAGLSEQSQADGRLLQAICRGDAEAVFSEVAAQQDHHRISGLAPIYVALRFMAPVRGEVLKYAQAIDGDGTSSVSFASVALRGGE
jgi:AmmeMemoRadiSam system protein B